eukprot:gene6652-7352_t
MLTFLQSPLLYDLFDEVDDFNVEKFIQLLFEQLDSDRDGSISLEELKDFLWPLTRNQSNIEIGVIIDLTRKALRMRLGSAAAAAQGNEEALLEEFTKLAKSVTKLGKQISTPIAKKALLNLYIPELQRMLSEDEVSMLLKPLDRNGDGVISAREFVSWLVPQNIQEDKALLANQLRQIVIDKFSGDIRAMFESFKSNQDGNLYKADFCSHLKVIDNSFPVQQCADWLFGRDKEISLGRLSDISGIAIVDHDHHDNLLHLTAEEVETEISPTLADGPDDNSFLPPRSPPASSSSAAQSNRLLVEEEKEQKDIHLSQQVLPQTIAVESIQGEEANLSINNNHKESTNNKNNIATTSLKMEGSADVVEKEKLDTTETSAALSLAEQQPTNVAAAIDVVETVPDLSHSNPMAHTTVTTTFDEASNESSVLFPQVNSPSMEVSMSHSVMMLSPTRLNIEEGEGDKPTIEEKQDPLLTPSPLSSTSHRFVFDLDQGGGGHNSAFATPPLPLSKGLGSSHSGRLIKAPSNMSTFSMMSSSKPNNANAGSSSSNSILPPISSYAASFNKLAQTLREYLLRECGGGQANHKEILEDAMRLIDENGSGVVTSTEILSFLQSSQLNSLFVDVEEANRDKFCQLLLEQIDCNREGNISSKELEEFLWPANLSPSKGGSSNVTSRNEGGIVIELCRKALLQTLGAAATRGDEAILEGFASLSKTIWKKGKQIENRIARKALQHLHIPEFHRALNDEETMQEDKALLANQLRQIVIDKFSGDIRAMFESFKSYGADCIYKADFITNLKALDPSLSRNVVQDITATLCGHEKGITFGKLSDFLGNINSIGRRRNCSMDSMASLGSNQDFLDEEGEVHTLEDLGEITHQDGGTGNSSSAGLSVDELKEAREFLQRTRGKHKNQTITNNNNSDNNQDSVLKTESTINSWQSNRTWGAPDHHHEVTQENVPHQAVGLSTSQMVEFGYLKHTGRWRGFPYDSWSCCNTANFVCPNNIKFLSNKQAVTTEAFITSIRLSPKKVSPKKMTTQQINALNASNEEKMLQLAKTTTTVKFKVKKNANISSQTKSQAFVTPSSKMTTSSSSLHTIVDQPTAETKSGSNTVESHVPFTVAAEEIIPNNTLSSSKEDKAVQSDGDILSQQMEQRMSTMINAASSSYQQALQSLRNELDEVRQSANRREVKQDLSETKPHPPPLQQIHSFRGDTTRRSSSEPPISRYNTTQQSMEFHSSSGTMRHSFTTRTTTTRRTTRRSLSPSTIQRSRSSNRIIPWIPPSKFDNGKFNRVYNTLPRRLAGFKSKGSSGQQSQLPPHTPPALPRRRKPTLDIHHTPKPQVMMGNRREVPTPNNRKAKSPPSQEVPTTTNNNRKPLSPQEVPVTNNRKGLSPPAKVIIEEIRPNYQMRDSWRPVGSSKSSTTITSTPFSTSNKETRPSTTSYSTKIAPTLSTFSPSYRHSSSSDPYSWMFLDSKEELLPVTGQNEQDLPDDFVLSSLNHHPILREPEPNQVNEQITSSSPSAVDNKKTFTVSSMESNDDWWEKLMAQKQLMEQQGFDQQKQQQQQVST